MRCLKCLKNRCRKGINRIGSHSGLYCAYEAQQGEKNNSIKQGWFHSAKVKF